MPFELRESLWHDSCGETVQGPRLTGDRHADLVVIGGGYTGLSAALQGARDGASVCLLDADEVGAGGSGRNVGLVNAGLWLPPEKIERRLGRTAGQHLSRVLAEAPDVVFGLIRDFAMNCEPVRKGTLHCAHAPGARAGLQHRLDQLNARGAPLRLLSRDEAVARVGSDQVHGALFDPRAGTIQPLGFAKGLARAATSCGVQLFEHSPALSVTNKGGQWQVSCREGSVTAPRLIMATNAYTVPIQGMPNPTIVPVHFVQAATDPLPAAALDRILPGKEGCWDSALVMSSWRLDRLGRLILGGMGNPGHLAGAVHRKWLERKLARMFPTLAGTPLRQTWAGRIAMTREYLPKILAPAPGVLIAFGFSGRGIGPGTVFGTRLAKALLGGDFADLPVPPATSHSLPQAGVRQGYYELGATLTHLVRDRR